MDELIRELNKYPNGTVLIIKWGNGLKIKGTIDTIYETDNGLSMDDEGYLEFYACILNILNNPSDSEELQECSLIEISMQNQPTEILQDNGTVIWKAVE